MTGLNVLLTVVAGAVTIAGALALGASVFRIKTRDDTIASQRGYIDALTDERDGLSRRVGVLEGQMHVLTSDFAHVIGKQVADVVREELRRDR